MKLKPIGDKIIVEPEKEEEKTKSGIVLPDTAKEKPQRGKVIAVGPGKILDNGQRSPMEIKEGDIVIYSKYAGTEIKIDDKEYLIVSDRDILSVLE